MTPARQFAPRRGFTILEVLIVMAIMLILIALTAGAALRYMDVQKKRNTEVELLKLDSAVRQAWNAVITKANDDTIPPAVLTMSSSTATPNTQRARVIYIKFRLLQEFPMTFAEVTTAVPGMPPSPYLSMIQGKTMNLSTKGENCESAALLYLALDKDRSGTRFNPDSVLAKSEVATDTKSGLKYIRDGWGEPIAFFRWPYGNTDLTEKAQLTAGTTNDLEDPTGLLYTTGWNTAQFTKLCHPVKAGQSFQLKPAIASPGRDGKLGLDATMAPVAGNTQWYDNLYSYRVRETGRGD